MRREQGPIPLEEIKTREEEIVSKARQLFEEGREKYQKEWERRTAENKKARQEGRREPYGIPFPLEMELVDRSLGFDSDSIERIAKGAKEEFGIEGNPNDVIDLPDQSESQVYRIPNEVNSWLTININREEGKDIEYRGTRFEFGENPRESMERLRMHADDLAGGF